MQANPDKIDTIIGYITRQSRHFRACSDGKHCCNWVIKVTPGRSASDHLDHGAPDAPNIALSPVLGLSYDFGRHEIRRSLEHLLVLTRNSRFVARVEHSEVFGRTEINQLADTVAVYENV